MARAFHSGYYQGSGRAGQVRRCHIMREDGRYAGKQGLCGTPGWSGQKSPVIILDPMPPAPPAGLSWCPACIGALAERMGAIDLFAAELAGVTR